MKLSRRNIVYKKFKTKKLIIIRQLIIFCFDNIVIIQYPYLFNPNLPQASKRLLDILLHAIKVSMSTNKIGDLWSRPTNKKIFGIQTFVSPNYANLSKGGAHPFSAHIATASMKFDTDTDEPKQKWKQLQRSKMRDIKVDHESDANFLEWYNYQNNIKSGEEKCAEDWRQLTHRS